MCFFMALLVFSIFPLDEVEEVGDAHGSYHGHD